MITFRKALLLSFLLLLSFPLKSLATPDSLDYPLVSSLSDVSPENWAYQALQQLQQQYNIPKGYPDGTFQGNQLLTREQFASILAKTLVQIQNKNPNISEENLNILQQLQNQFAPELAVLRGQVDGLEARITEQELTQFSTTTILNGYIWTNLLKAGTSGKIKAEGTDIITAFRNSDNSPIIRYHNQSVTTFSNLIYLDLITSFNGRDKLLLEIASGNGFSSANLYNSAGRYDTSGVPGTETTPGLEFNQPVFQEINYQFPVNNALKITLGPRMNWFRFFDLNNYTANSNSNNANNSLNSPILPVLGYGGGVVTEWKINDQWQLNTGYLSESEAYFPEPRSINNPSQGLFGGTHTLTGELTFSPSKSSNIRVFYERALGISPNDFGQIDRRPIYGVADDGFGGQLTGATSDLWGVNFDWRVSPKLAVFGRYSHTNTTLNPVDRTLNQGTVRSTAMQAGFSLFDIGKEGGVLNFSYVLPYNLVEGKQYLVSGGGNGTNQHEFELSYFYPVNQSISFVPSLYLVIHPNNFSDNPPLWIGNFITQLSF